MLYFFRSERKRGMFIKHEGNEDLNYENRESVDWPKREISSTAAENVGTNVKLYKEKKYLKIQYIFSFI